MIILNKMYSGDYLKENIGHEFINEYTTDDGEQYIYVNPWQNVRNLDKGDNYIIQVRYAGKNCYEVISYAKIEKYNAKDKGKGLKYGGFQLGELLGNNDTGYPNSSGIYAHLKAIDFKRCKANTYLRFDKECHLPDGATPIDLAGFEFGRQNSRRYVFTPKDKKEHCDELIKFINTNEYWQEVENSKLSPKKYNPAEINIIDVIGKQYEELTFSNWLAFYLRNSQLCKRFISECLKPNKIDESFLANLTFPKREHHNIDIWIESEKMIIVIENKIDSGLNGIKQIEDGKFTNQLEKYHKFAETCAKQNNKKNVYYYVIKPNYNQLTIGEKNKDWKVIEYLTILKFFDKISEDESFKDLPYIQEFVKALKPLTQTRKIDYKDIIKNRLMERIAALRTEQGNK